MAGMSSFINRRTRSTFLTSMVVISMVLLLLGFFFSFALYSRIELRNQEATLEMRVVLSSFAVGAKKDSLMTYIQSQPWAREVKFISKDEAARIFAQAVGDASDFTELTDGVNPLPASINVKLHPDWVKPDKVSQIQAMLAVPEVERVSYPIERMEQFRKNVDRYLRIAGIAGLVVLLIAFFIIHSTIRLAIFSRRLVIRSMQLIGATSSFIRWPFVRMGMLQGLFAGILADLFLILLIYLSRNALAGFGDPVRLLDDRDFLLMLGGIVIFGTVLGWLSSRLAVNRFLNRSLDELM